MRSESAGWLTSSRLADFATDKQQAALATMNADSLQQADDHALAEAILASLGDLKNKASPNSSSVYSSPERQVASHQSIKSNNSPAKSATVPQEYYDGSKAINLQLRNWLGNHGFDIIPNSGKNSNCLLISMVQHAKGNYSSEHDADVNGLRQTVKDYTKHHYPDNPSINDYSLLSDDDVTDMLVEKINLEIPHVEDKLSFCFVTADIDGQPLWRRVGDGPKMAIIFDQGGHYEAVIPRNHAGVRQAASQPPR